MPMECWILLPKHAPRTTVHVCHSHYNNHIICRAPGKHLISNTAMYNHTASERERGGAGDDVGRGCGGGSSTLMRCVNYNRTCDYLQIKYHGLDSITTPFLSISYVIPQHWAQWKLMANHTHVIQLIEGTLSSTISLTIGPLSGHESVFKKGLPKGN